MISVTHLHLRIPKIATANGKTIWKQAHNANSFCNPGLYMDNKYSINNTKCACVCWKVVFVSYTWNSLFVLGIYMTHN